MSKTKSKFIFLLFMFYFSFVSSNANAFLGLLPSTVFDPGALATQIVNNVNAEIKKVTGVFATPIKRALNLAKSLKDAFVNLLTKKENKIPGTKNIKKSKIADIYDENSIRPAFNKLFFEYPSDQPRIMNAYRRKGQEFYDDTLIEAFTAVRLMESRLGELDQKIIEAQEKSSSADDYNGGLNNLYLLNQTTDEMLVLIQELVAIKAQMVAADAVLNQVEPLYYGAPTVGIRFE